MLPLEEMDLMTPEELAEELDAIQAALEAELFADFDAAYRLEQARAEEQTMHASEDELPW